MNALILAPQWEFGPLYMVTSPSTREPLADQFELNRFIKNLISNSLQQIK